MRGFVTRAVLVGGVALGVLRLAAACVDVTPIEVPAREASVIEGEPCLACLEKPNGQLGCADELDVCKAEPRCRAVYDCMAEGACLEYAVMDDKVTCTIPCLEGAEIYTMLDPVVDLLVNVLTCGERGCAAQCGIVDGGVDLVSDLNEAEE